MLKDDVDDVLLHRLHNAAEVVGPRCSGPLEAYATVTQLRNLS